MSKRIEDLLNIETEHMIGQNNRPLIKIRCENDTTLLLGQLSPEMARDIANHLHEAAARAEYEHDLLSEMERLECDDGAIAAVFKMVRHGEMRRMTDTT